MIIPFNPNRSPIISLTQRHQNLSKPVRVHVTMPLGCLKSIWYTEHLCTRIVSMYKAFSYVDAYNVPLAYHRFVPNSKRSSFVSSYSSIIGYLCSVQRREAFYLRFHKSLWIEYRAP